MRIHFLWCVFLLTACSHPGGNYETLLQVDPAQEQGKVFVLALVKEMNPSATPDTGMADFVITPGESATKSVGNKYFPNRIYEFKVVTSAPSAVSTTIEVTTTVRDGSKVLYNSKQKVRHYEAPAG